MLYVYAICDAKMPVSCDLRVLTVELLSLSTKERDTFMCFLWQLTPGFLKTANFPI